MSENSGVRTPNRWGEGSRLRDDIVAAAGRLLAESGREESLSLRAVARAVGIAPPSIYLHFKDRSELVATVMRVVYDELVTEMRQVRARASAQGPAHALRAMAHGYCRFALGNPRRYRLMFGVEQIDIPKARMVEHPVNEVLSVWTEATGDCSRLGTRDSELPAERKAVLLWAGLHGIVALWSVMPVEPDVEYIYNFADDLVDTLLG